jgi:hypothetical protein
VAEGKPLWLKGVLRAERLVGSRVESAVHSDTYFNLVTQVKRSTGWVSGAAEGVSKRVLHLANLPAGTDIRRVREQLARMERRIVELSKELDEHAAQRHLELADGQQRLDRAVPPPEDEPHAEHELGAERPKRR